MSKKLPRMTARELIAVLKRSGFVLVRSKGSHQTFFHRFKHLHITIPAHQGKIIGAGLLNVILKQAQISRDSL